LAFLGVVAFSGTLPATRVAVQELDAVFVGLGREVLAAVLAAAVLLVLREPFPRRDQVPRLALAALGVVVGWPLLSALSLRGMTAAEGAVIVGLLPMATAVVASLRADETPSTAFWAAAGLGLVAVLAFAAVQGAGLPRGEDLVMLAAVAVSAVGYSEGAALAREMGGWRVISWALVLFAPLLIPFVLLVGTGDGSPGAGEWLGFAYVTVVSAFAGFFAWYAGLARGGIARTSQVQLAQPLLTFLWSALFLGESISLLTFLAGLAVLACVAVTQRTSVDRDPLLASDS
jgi:drug/metabolite transporter (DMT)-like permease